MNSNHDIAACSNECGSVYRINKQAPRSSTADNTHATRPRAKPSPARQHCSWYPAIQPTRMQQDPRAKPGPAFQHYSWYPIPCANQLLEKLEIGPYPGHDLFRTSEMRSRGQMKANGRSEKYNYSRIKRLIRKSWSRLLIRKISREPFEKTVKNMTKMTEFWKILEFLEIDQDWSRKLPEASETNFEWFWSHGKPPKAISRNAEIS